MPAFPLRSQRRAAGPAGPAAGGALLAGLLAAVLPACSLISPATFAPAQSVAAATDMPTAPTATATPLPATPTPTTPAPSASPPPPAARWRSISKVLTAPAAWLDFGFARNGDLLAIGTRDATADSLRLFVARFSPTGRRKADHSLSRSVTPIPGDWASFDPSDDSILIDDYNLPTGTFTLRSFSSSNGSNVANVPSESGINRVAIDEHGRVYGLPQYGVDGNAYAAIVRLDALGRVKVGVDYWLRPLDAGPRPDRPGVLAFATAITVGRDGSVVVVDVPDFDATYEDGTPRQSAVVTFLGPNLGSPRQWELASEWEFGSAGFGTWSHSLAIAGASDGSLYVGEPVLDEAGKAIVGWRVRHFGPFGGQLGEWGAAVADSGVLQPTHPAVDATGRLWVIETDPATGRSEIAVLSLPA